MATRLEPFRERQIEKARFDVRVKSWEEVTVLPKALREALAEEQPWMSVKSAGVFVSARGDTHKAILEMADGQRMESVLMENRRGQWTICVSSQVGCAMKCGFCATGKMGLQRNLSAEEIVDQYRFWQMYLNERPELPQRISNVVFMGMGEPLANYENVKKAIHVWLLNTDLGPTHITVSTVGLLPVLEQILKDPEWPETRLAISLHSADPETRKEIVPTSFENFVPKLKDWCARYLKLKGTRRRHLTFEYVMLSGVNDTEHHAKVLAKMAADLGKIKVNLIPYNFTDLDFKRSTNTAIEKFKSILEGWDVAVTVRKTMGDDIAAACGQLITIGQK